MNRQKRAKIYYEAAKIVESENEYCCMALASYIDYEFDLLQSSFPEFFLFKPVGLKDETERWWAGSAQNGEDIQPRVLALLFCHEMALNP